MKTAVALWVGLSAPTQVPSKYSPLHNATRGSRVRLPLDSPISLSPLEAAYPLPPPAVFPKMYIDGVYAHLIAFTGQLLIQPLACDAQIRRLLLPCFD